MSQSTFPKKGALASRQQGVALMIVILVFALVSILAVGMYNRQSLFVQSSANVFAQSQAYQYALASEIYGKRLLKADWDDDKDANEFVDDLEQVQNAIVIPVEEAFLEAQFNDVQGKLNVNDLVNLDGSENTLVQERFKRLLNRLALESVNLETLQDWIDENQEPSNFEGAEDGDYLGLEIPYRTGSQPFYHLSELLLLQGITRQDYEKLIQYVSVLPQGMAPVNVNTASEEVLQSLVEDLSDAEAKDLVATREEKPWVDVNAFLSEAVLNGKKVDQNYLSVNSSFFEIATRISLSDRKVRLLSLIYRKPEDGEMTVVKRDQGQKYLITKEALAL